MEEDQSHVEINRVFCEEALEMHNIHRARHGADPLVLSERLAKSAQGWAETLLDMTMLQNSPLANQGEVGENISMRRGSDTVDINGALLDLHSFCSISFVFVCYLFYSSLHQLYLD